MPTRKPPAVAFTAPQDKETPVSGSATTNVPISLPPFYPWQQQVWEALHDPAIRFVVCSTAQQVGKTSLGVLWCIEGALQGKDSWWVAPDYTLTEAGYDILTSVIAQPPFPSLVREEKKRLRFNFSNAGKNGWIQLRSADDPNKLRSRTLDRVVFDEAALAVAEAWHGNLSERLTIRRGKALIIFNPHGKNWAWELWRRGDPDNPNRDPEWRSFQFSQYDNPMISPADIEHKRKTMPWRQFQSEVMGDFVDSGGIVFVGLRAAATAPLTSDPNPDHRYVGGLDFGSRQDWTVGIIYDATAHMQVAIYRFQEPVWERQFDLLTEINRKWNVQHWDAEENAAGDQAIQSLEARGLRMRRYNANMTTKRPLIEAWSGAIELGLTRILPDEHILREHESMESDVTLNGTVRFFGGHGANDDCVIASALAYRAATVGDAFVQPGFVRGTATGLYDTPAVGSKPFSRQYPSWNRANVARRPAPVPVRKRSAYEG